MLFPLKDRRLDRPGASGTEESRAGRCITVRANSGENLRWSLGWLRKRVFGISAEEASFARRGFRGGDERIRWRLEGIGRVFLHGYHAALQEDRPVPLALRLDELEPGLRGFAFEGAGMGLYLLDMLTPWN